MRSESNWRIAIGLEFYVEERLVDFQARDLLVIFEFVGAHCHAPWV
jgi:hypothetical protein